MSYARLVFNGDYAQATVEELLDQVVLFIIHRRAAQGRNRGEMVHPHAVFFLFYKIGIARLLHPLGDPLHCPFQRAFFPVIGKRGAVQHLGDAMGIDRELKGIGAFGAECTFIDRAGGVTSMSMTFPALV